MVYGITKNEAKVLNFVVRNFNERNSINEIGRRLKLSPMGIYKILKKLEKVNAIRPEKIGNGIYYKANLDDEMSIKLAEFVLAQNDLNPYARIQAEDLNQLKDVAIGCILYGSVLKKGKEANDIDFMPIIDHKKNAEKYYIKFDELRQMKPKKLHDIAVIKEDLVKGIKKNDVVIIRAIKEGEILWGSEVVVEAIRNGTS